MVDYLRDIRRLECLFSECVEGEVPEPRVTPHLVGAIEPKSVVGLPLDHSVDEVRALDAPPRRDLVSLYLHLLGQDVVSDFLSSLSHIGSLIVIPINLLCPSCTRSR
jgi:hypothetical protein